MMTPFANLNARASSARHRCTALVLRLSLRRCVRTNALGQFSKKLGSSRKKCSPRQELRAVHLNRRRAVEANRPIAPERRVHARGPGRHVVASLAGPHAFRKAEL